MTKTTIDPDSATVRCGQKLIVFDTGKPRSVIVAALSGGYIYGLRMVVSSAMVASKTGGFDSTNGRLRTVTSKR